MKFTSQACTTKEQSERLLALGLKKETADCVAMSLVSIDSVIWTEYPMRIIEVLDSKNIPNYPAWSLHRLMEICPTVINNPPRFVAISSFKTSLVLMSDKISDNFNRGETYDNIIDCIEWLIKEGHFNKNYLEK